MAGLTFPPSPSIQRTGLRSGFLFALHPRSPLSPEAAASRGWLPHSPQSPSCHLDAPSPLPPPSPAALRSGRGRKGHRPACPEGEGSACLTSPPPEGGTHVLRRLSVSHLQRHWQCTIQGFRILDVPTLGVTPAFSGPAAHGSGSDAVHCPQYHHRRPDSRGTGTWRPWSGLHALPSRWAPLAWQQFAYPRLSLPDFYLPKLGRMLVISAM